MRTRSPWVRLALMSSAVGLFVIGYYWGNQHKYVGGPPAIEGVLIAPAMPLPRFALEDAEGHAFTVEDLADHWTLLAFGEISSARGQLAATHMIDVYNRLGDQPVLRAQVQLALAATAHAPNLAWDFSRLSPALRILSGPDEEIRRLAAPLGEPPEGRGDARSAIYLIAPDGNLLALFSASQPTETVAADLAALSEWPLEALANRHDDALHPIK